MSTKAIKRKAAEHLDFGIPKQQVYGLLLAEHPAAKPKKVAEVLRYMPTLMARERFGALHLALLGLIGLYGLLRVLRPILEPDFSWEMSYRLVSLVPIATLLMGWSIYRWQGRVFRWVGWMNVIGVGAMIRTLTDLNNGGGDVQQALQSALSVGVGALALYLAHHVFAKPKVEKDPLGAAPPRYVFPPEPRGAMM